MTFEIREARLHHCGKLARYLRREHAQAFALLGVDNVHASVVETYRQSYLRRVLYHGDTMLAMWGCMGPFLSPFGFIWAGLTEDAKRFPLQVMRVARQEIDEMMVMKRELTTTIIPTDTAALRFAAFLGFHFEHIGDGMPAMSPGGRRRLVRAMQESADIRIPHRNGYVVRVGYHEMGEA